MNSRDNLMTERFLVNMGRIHRLVKLVMSDIEILKPPGLFQSSEGTRADLLRVIVVFLHATFEDFLRSSISPRENKNWTFSSVADIEKVLRKNQLDPAPFKPLYPPLRQMAKRRHRIVHDADLAKKTDIAPEACAVADDWQLIMWLLTVSAFNSLFMSIAYGNRGARARYGKLREAMDNFVVFGKQLIALPKMPPDLQQRMNALEKL